MHSTKNLTPAKYTNLITPLQPNQILLAEASIIGESGLGLILSDSDNTLVERLQCRDLKFTSSPFLSSFDCHNQSPTHL